MLRVYNEGGQLVAQREITWKDLDIPPELFSEFIEHLQTIASAEQSPVVLTRL